MPEFVLQIDLTNHRHPENLAAEHRKVCEWLKLAWQAIGSSSNRSGDLMVPVWDLSVGASRPAKIGSWSFIEDEQHNAEAA